MGRLLETRAGLFFGTKDSAARRQVRGLPTKLRLRHQGVEHVAENRFSVAPGKAQRIVGVLQRESGERRLERGFSDVVQVAGQGPPGAAMLEYGDAWQPAAAATPDGGRRRA